MVRTMCLLLRQAVEDSTVRRAPNGLPTVAGRRRAPRPKFAGRGGVHRGSVALRLELGGRVDCDPGARERWPPSTRRAPPGAATSADSRRSGENVTLRSGTSAALP